jgi:hypothetical protein
VLLREVKARPVPGVAAREALREVNAAHPLRVALLRKAALLREVKVQPVQPVLGAVAREALREAPRVKYPMCLQQ